MVYPKHHFEIGTARATARIQHPQTFHLPISRGNILGYLSRSRSKSTQPESRTASDVAVTSSSNFGTTLGAKVGELGVTSSSYRRWKCSVSSWTHFQIRDLQLFVKHRETSWNIVCLPCAVSNEKGSSLCTYNSHIMKPYILNSTMGSRPRAVNRWQPWLQPSETQPPCHSAVQSGDGSEPQNLAVSIC